MLSLVSHARKKRENKARRCSTHNLLSDHAAHADTNDIEFSLASPTEMVHDLNNVFGHFGG